MTLLLLLLVYLRLAEITLIKKFYMPTNRNILFSNTNSLETTSELVYFIQFASLHSVFIRRVQCT